MNVYVISKYSPKEKHGVKGPNALNMLVNMLKQYVFGKEIYSTLELKAVSLVRNLVQKHVLFNGNKRNTLISLGAFLNINGYQLTIINTEATDCKIKITTDDLEEEIINKWVS
ncbi:type II toxin-antitoxin system death-on-curing family toxin [Staphylococcus pasteuri]|uniref:type II toxin-antitoxin system death-on-curing family toxin n=1 Tax=Staphylococcus pasteuri TaxID=45972 RepID=UPI000E69CBF3|nr:type II toxin-antitoxin system death-on-curing family toxin [Staphylococcus pasteuri]RIO54578.1 type II toxin-antitoxin system death-on-curing family toxin [Staphylococcus pasteuri]